MLSIILRQALLETVDVLKPAKVTRNVSRNTGKNMENYLKIGPKRLEPTCWKEEGNI